MCNNKVKQRSRLRKQNLRRNEENFKNITRENFSEARRIETIAEEENKKQKTRKRSSHTENDKGSFGKKVTVNLDLQKFQDCF